MLTVAFDTGPLHGPITGIGRAVSGVRTGLEGRRDDVRLVSYVLSFRAELAPSTTRLPLPASLAVRSWSMVGRPRVDRWFADCDLIHGTNYVVPPSRRARLVSVYDCWALDNPAECRPAVRTAMRALRRSIDEGVAVHSSSHATARRLRELFPDVDVTVVHLGPPNPTIESTLGSTVGSAVDPTDGAPFVLALGTIERRKNLATLVRAWNRLDDPDLHLVVAGSAGDDRDAVERAIAEVPASRRRRIHLLGRVDDDAARTLLAQARLLAYPSLDEGFGFPLLEAMASGVPIVASDAGSIPEVAGDAAILVSATDDDALARSIGRVHHDDALRASLVDAGARRLAHFSWDRTATEMLDLYRRIVGGS